MPAPRKSELIHQQYFAWRLGKRRGIYVADGRSNPVDVGRHSLGVRDRAVALEQLARLDRAKAVEYGLAPSSILEAAATHTLALEEGRDLYLKHVSRPVVLGGASAGTVKRYRAVLNKFVKYAAAEGVRAWHSVTKTVLQGYAAWLDDEGYDYRTEYLELTTLKQLMKWLVSETRLPTSCLIVLPLKKPQGTTTYCYRPEEVQAMVAHCSAREDLAWLGDVIVALAVTGLRIGELASLRWDDLDDMVGSLSLRDTSYQGSRTDRQTSRRTKGHRDRILPIHPDLRRRLEAKEHHADGRVFHGPSGGKLKPDTVRTILARIIQRIKNKSLRRTSKWLKSQATETPKEANHEYTACGSRKLLLFPPSAGRR